MIQHIFCIYCIALRGIIDKHMCYRTNHFAILNERRTTHTLNNTACGIYGNVSALMKEKLEGSTLMQTAHKEEVVCGKALLRCAVNGEPQAVFS